PDVLGENATKEFVLRHVFEIAPEFIKQPSDLLRVLLRRHYRGQHIPSILDERLIQLLRQNNTFDNWPLEILVSDREAFFAFLQERWPVFLDHLAAKGAPSAQEEQKPYVLIIDGPRYLPFDDHDIRVYMDNLFLEGFLQSVPHEHEDALPRTWVSFGIKTDPAEDRSRRLAKLIENLQSSIPAEDARHGEWFHFARGWAELTVLVHDQENAIHSKDTLNLKSLQSQVDAAFF